MTHRIQTRQLFNTSNALRVFPDFPSNPRILLRHSKLSLNSPYPVSPARSRPSTALVDPAPAMIHERRPSWPKKRSGRVRRGSQSWIVCRSRCRLDVQAAKACSIGGTTQASSGSRGVVCDSSSLFDHPACSRLGRLSTRGWRIHHVVLLAK